MMRLRQFDAMCDAAHAVAPLRSAIRRVASVDANVTPCFTPGTVIATPQGERPVEDLQVGDGVITRDNGIQDIRWTGLRHLTGRALSENAHLCPVLIRKGALGADLPERDMYVSPNHRMLVASDQTAHYFREREVLTAAKHLVNHRGIQQFATTGTTYIHFMCNHHEVVLANGAWSESFQPDDYSLKGLGNAQRNEILAVFPELGTEPGVANYLSARRILSRREARQLSD